MERRLFIETFGLLTKVEHVRSIDVGCQPKTLVLEITQPYPGYYSVHDIDTDTPRTVFIITREQYSVEHVIRLGYEAQRQLAHPVDLTPCRISIYADSYYGIRVKQLASFDMLKSLQEMLRNEGVSFMRYRPIDEMASIEIQKLFNLEEVLEGIYQDLDEPGERYIALSEKLDFGQFVKVSKAVKHNIDNPSFDAALAVFFRKHGVIDAVRIFEPNIHLDDLIKIRSVYEEQIRRLKLKEI